MKIIICTLALSLLSACGDKVPESKAAKELGNVPKQTIDKTASDLDKALAKGVERKDADEKK